METEDDGADTSLYFILFSLLLLLIILLSKTLHESPRWNSVLSEAALVLILGSATGAIVQFCILQDTGQPSDEDDGAEYPKNYALALSLLNFDPHIFFFALLPPIMFNSGFELRRELFYRHITPIVMFACIGTVLSALTTAGILILARPFFPSFSPTAMELLAFGALISATDAVSVIAIFQERRVDPHLFSLVFGESALNDAVALVLFNVFSHFVATQYYDSGSVLQRVAMFVLEFLATALFSPILGMAFGVLAALIFKHFDMRKYPKFELAIYIMLMYVPFLVAEECSLSGIVAIFFTGMSACRYVNPNVSETTQRNADSVFRLAAYVAETAIFLELGMSLFGLHGSFHWLFIFCATIATLFGRALSIYPLAYMYNVSLRELPPTEELLDTSKDDDDSQSSSARRRTPFKRKDQKISVNMLHMVWFAGLRGAVAYACARDFPNVNGHNDEITAATMVMVLVTIIGMGGTTDMMLRILQIDVGVDEKKYMENWHKERELKGAFHSFEQRYIYNVAVRQDSSSDKPSCIVDETTKNVDYESPNAASIPEMFERPPVVVV